MNNIQTISLDMIEINPYQPRLSEDPEHVQAIAESIEIAGLLQIPSGRRTAEGKVQLAFGMTRFSAMKLLHSKRASVLNSDYASMPVNIVEFSDLQMFEAAITENIRRKDLNHIERATAMSRYMDEFASTSAQVGELFGVNESTVRGALRLLELPQNAKEAVADGSISIGTARQLLTLKKLAPKMMENTVEDLRAGRVENQDPKRLIDAMIRKGALEMWERWRGEDDAKAGRDLWPLDYEFNGSFDFPLWKDFEKEYAGPENLGSWKPKNVFEMAQRKFKNQDPRQLPGIQYGAGAFVSLRSEYPGLEPVIDLVEQLVTPPTCSACPFHAVIDGAHFCGVKLCHARKVERWTEKQIKAYAQENDIHIYDAEKDGKFDWMDNTNPNSDDRKLIAEKNENVRLMAKFVTGWDNHAFTNNDLFGLVVVGEIAENRKEARKLRDAAEKRQKAEEKAKQASEKADPFAYEKRSAIREILSTQFRLLTWNLASDVYQKVLGTTLSFGVLDTLTDKFYTNLPEIIEEDNESTVFLSVYLVYAMLEDVYEIWEAVREDDPVLYFSERIGTLFSRWGAQIPQKWTAELETVRERITNEIDTAIIEIEAQAVEA